MHNFMAVLAHIAENSDFNQMTPGNLSICVGPTLLWPSEGAVDVLKNEIQLTVQFIIENYTALFGLDPPAVVQSASMVETADDMNALSLSVETLDAAPSDSGSEGDDFRDRSRAISCFSLAVDGEIIDEVNQLASKMPDAANELRKCASANELTSPF